MGRCLGLGEGRRGWCRRLDGLAVAYRMRKIVGEGSGGRGRGEKDDVFLQFE